MGLYSFSKLLFSCSFYYYSGRLIKIQLRTKTNTDDNEKKKNEALLIDINVIEKENCYPMVAPGRSNSQMLGLEK
jgi:acetolactate synthase-1/2/3 large subunit